MLISIMVSSMSANVPMLEGRLVRQSRKLGSATFHSPPIVVNALKTWRADCPQWQLDLVFSNDRGNIERMSNIHELFWYPLPIKCGLTVDTGNRDMDGGPILGHRYGFHMLWYAAASLFIRFTWLDAETAPGRHGAFIHQHA
jgi:hypothetical protein